MKKLSFVLLALLACPSYAAVYDLDVAMDNVRNACRGINSKMDHLKLMAGINTGIGAVGTVTGAVALGTGIAKAQKDKEIESLSEMFNKLKPTKPENILSPEEVDKAIEKFKKKLPEYYKNLQTSADVAVKHLTEESKMELNSLLFPKCFLKISDLNI